jgi:hypothetical protein
MIIRVKYDGTALPTDSDTFTLWDSTGNNAYRNSSSADIINQHSLKRCNVSVECSHKGTLTASWSDDDGTEWNVYDQRVMPASGTNMAHQFSIDIAGRRDVKIEWVNGGTTQTNFDVQTSLTSDQGNPWSGDRHFPGYVASANQTSTVTGDALQIGPERRVAFHMTTASGGAPTGDGHALQGTMDGGTTWVAIDNSSSEFDALAASLDDTAIFTNVDFPFIRLVCTISGGTANSYAVRATTT